MSYPPIPGDLLVSSRWTAARVYDLDKKQFDYHSDITLNIVRNEFAIVLMTQASVSLDQYMYVYCLRQDCRSAWYLFDHYNHLQIISRS